jgi:hypothetical protein
VRVGGTAGGFGWGGRVRGTPGDYPERSAESVQQNRQRVGGFRPEVNIVAYDRGTPSPKPTRNSPAPTPTLTRFLPCVKAATGGGEGEGWWNGGWVWAGGANHYGCAP